MDVKLEIIDPKPALGDIVRTKRSTYLIVHDTGKSKETAYSLVDLQTGETNYNGESVEKLISMFDNITSEVHKNKDILLTRKQG